MTSRRDLDECADEDPRGTQPKGTTPGGSPPLHIARDTFGTVLTDTAAHLLELVTVALDEFETAELPSTVRRAWRIARLRGDTVEASRFAMELGVEEHPDGLGMDERAAAEAWFNQGRSMNDIDPRLLDLTDAGLIALTAGSLDEMVSMPTPYEDELALRSRIEGENRRFVTRRVLGRVRNDTADYLMQCEASLRLAATGGLIFDRHRTRVDQHLRAVAPDVLAKLNAAIERAAAGDDSEARSHALTSCRRVLETVANHVFPPRAEPYVDANGKERPVGKLQYRNRLLAAIESAGVTTLRRALAATIEDIASRLDRLDDLTQKGVHEEPTAADVDFGVIHTYLIAGEVLQLTA